jgi:hypothetical protein
VREYLKEHSDVADAIDAKLRELLLGAKAAAPAAEEAEEVEA